VARKRRDSSTPEGNLATLLGDFRDERNDREELWNTLGYHDSLPTPKQQRNILRILIDKFTHGDTNANILKMAWDISPVYDGLRIGGRRKRYIERNGLYTEETLREKEDKLIDEIAKYILQVVRPGKFPSFIERIQKEAEANAIDSHILTARVPIVENKNILGRDSLVDEFHERLQSRNARLQLRGMGGSGKSEILGKLYARLANDIEASSFSHIGLFYYSGNLSNDIVNQLIYPGEKDEVSVLNYLKELCDNNQVLLLIDDIREKQFIEGSLVQQDFSFSELNFLGASILLASRTHDETFSDIAIEPLSMSVCAEIFLKAQRKSSTRDGSRGTTSLSEADCLILKDIVDRRAGYNPLIVSRLGIIARDYSFTIEKLAEQLEEIDFNITKSIDDDEKLQAELNKLYNFEVIRKLAEKNILGAFALFPAIPLDVETCLVWLKEDAGITENDCRLVLKRLERHTWLVSYEDEDGITASYSMHQMVRSAIISQTDISLKNHRNLAKHCRDAISHNYYKSEDANAFSKVKVHVPHANAIARWFYAEDDLEIASLLVCLGQYFVNVLGEYANALEYYKRALFIREEILGCEHEDTATSYSHVAEALFFQGKYDESIEYNQKTLKVFEKSLEPNDLNLATIYTRIALGYSRQCDYDPALKYNFKGLDIYKKEYETNQLQIATTYNNIARVFYLQKKNRDSLSWYEKSRDIRERKQGKNHPDMADLYDNMSLVYLRLKEYDEAMKLSKKALFIREKELGKKNPKTATSYTNMALIYYHQENYSEALEWYKKARHINEEMLGLEHSETALLYHNIASIYCAQNRYTEALALAQVALTVFCKRLPPAHPYITAAQNLIQKIKNTQKSS